MKKIFITIVLSFITIAFVYSQEFNASDCTPTHRKAEFSIYLTYKVMEEERIKAGTTNISLNEVRHVDNPVECRRITRILNSVPRLKEINDFEETTKFYYKTNNFYYVFWEEIHKNMLGGPRSIFIVIKKDNEEIFTCFM